MAESRHINVRLTLSTAEALDAYAAANGMTRTEAVERLLSDALRGAEKPSEADRAEGGTEANTGTDKAVLDILRRSNVDLRHTVSVLTAQVEADRQHITALLDQNAGLLMVTNQSQQLQAVEHSKALAETSGRMSWRLRLSRWIHGR